MEIATNDGGGGGGISSTVYRRWLSDTLTREHEVLPQVLHSIVTRPAYTMGRTIRARRATLGMLFQCF